jgi:hypothetical protein
MRVDSRSKLGNEKILFDRRGRWFEIIPHSTNTDLRAVSSHFLRRRMLESRRIFAKFKIGWELRNSGEFLCYV